MVDSYTLVVFAHVLSAMALVGHSLGAPLVHARIREVQTQEALRASLEIARLSARWNPATSMVLLASGIYLGAVGAWWEQGWFAVAVAAWVANSVLAVRVVQRSVITIGNAVARAAPGPIGADVDRLRSARSVPAALQAMLANDLAILYVMVAKPSAAGSLVLLVLATAVLTGASLARHHGIAGAPSGRLSRSA